MNVSLYQAAAAMNASSRWQEVIADNLAAASSPAYKRQDISFATVQAGYLARTGQLQSGRVLLPAARPGYNFQQGELKYSGQSTDLAISGEGFFEVRTPQGVSAFTRDGEFHVSPQGQLVNKAGCLVIGDGGPIQLNPANPEGISVSPTGEVSQAGEVRGRLRIVTFNDPQLLTHGGAGMFFAQNPQLTVTALSEPEIRQGVVEASNVRPMAEMASLITSMRQYETNQRLIQIHDDRMGKAIAELGSPA